MYLKSLLQKWPMVHTVIAYSLPGVVCGNFYQAEPSSSQDSVFYLADLEWRLTNVHQP